MELQDLKMYLEDLLRMGFVSKQIDSEGKPHYTLTDLGLQSGMKDLPN